MIVHVHHEFRSTSSPHSTESSEIVSHLGIVCANLPTLALSFSDEDDISDATIHDIACQTIPPCTSSEIVADSQYTSTLNTTENRHLAGILHHRMENVILRSDEFSSVINLSQRRLSDTEVSVLSKGFSFCPVPRDIDGLKLKQDLNRIFRYRHCNGR